MIEGLRVGDVLPNCFGRPREVTGRGTSDRGKAFVCFYQRFGEHSTMSNSLREGDPVSCFLASIGPDDRMAA